MLKFRCWDKIDQRFIYPVIDITNDFYQNYPPERFVFDKFVFKKDGIGYYENDIIEIPFINSNNKSRKKLFYAVIRPNHLERGDWAIYRLKYDPDFSLDFYTDIIDNTYRTLPHYDSEPVILIGNIHQHFNILKEWYLNQKK